MPAISNLVKEIAPSATLSLKDEVSSLEKQYGFKIIDLTTGQPDTGPTDDILQALWEGGKLHKYGPVKGDPELRGILSEVISGQTGASYDAEDIAITVGVKGGLDILMKVLLGPGEKAGIIAPFWVTYPESVRLAHGIPCFLESDQALRPDPARLRKQVADNNIKVLLYSSPSNPSGVVYTEDELGQIAKIVKEKDIWVISDEIYAGFVFHGRKHSSILSIEGMRDNAILVDGPSKRFGVPGWRLGYVAGPRQIIAAVTKLQGHVNSGPSRPEQYAMRVAYTSQKAKQATEEMRQRYERNADIFVFGLIEPISCVKPEGAFYAFACINQLFGCEYQFADNQYVIKTSIDFRNFLLRKAQVAAVEGSAFGMDGYIRFSLATKREEVSKALANIKDAVSQLWL
ncbi:Aspartate aminotransferase [subsurface metagenome]